MSELARKQLNYTIACIHEFAKKNSMSQQAAFKYLKKYQGIAFLSEFYDVEHTLSIDDALEDMTMVCRQNPDKGNDIQETDKPVFFSHRESDRLSEEGGCSEMSKAEMLMEYTTQDVVSWIMDEEGLGMEDALDRFYSSVTFEKLTDRETGLYLDAPASIYCLYKDEQAAGEFAQNEV